MAERDAIKDGMFDVEAQIGATDEAFIPALQQQVEAAKSKVQELNNRILELSNGQNQTDVEVPATQTDTNTPTGEVGTVGSPEVAGQAEGQTIGTDTGVDDNTATTRGEEVVVPGAYGDGGAVGGVGGHGDRPRVAGDEPADGGAGGGVGVGGGGDGDG
jgi:outer membrane murein-binding lipoprotein Lpp